tara:strand:- start:10 stop:702 length:693 start_codon:yes stop_codon:yes gene_type:complete
MVRIFKSFKFFRKRLLFFCIFINLIFIFPNSILAHETYGDAMNWYRDKNFVINPKQNFLIGLKLEDEGKIKTALYFFKHAADNGLTEAQIKVGLYLIKSDDQEDHIEAREIFQLLSEKEIPSASFKLGWMYENGIGGERNIIKAATSYKIAASRNENNAYLYLANLALIDQSDRNILLAASYSTIAKKKKVKGSERLLNSLLPMLETGQLDEIEILVSSLESEIQKIKTN